MAYQNNIPQPGDAKNKSQADMLGNFAAIQTLVDVNHVDFADAVNQGKHNIVTLPLTLTSPSAPSFLSTEQGLYNLVNSTTTTNEIYVHKQTVDSGTEVAMTASRMSSTAKATCVNGWSYLPSGLLIVWGNIGATSGSSVSITPVSSSSSPNFSKVFKVFLTPSDTAGTTFTCGQSTTPNDTTGNFSAFLNNPSATTSINYLVIGV